MGELSLGRGFTWIPSGVGKKDGWVLVRKIDLGDGSVGMVYEVEENDWLPNQMSGVDLPDSASKNKNESKKSKQGEINWDEQPLGEVTDKQLAVKLGVTAQAVCKARNRRGIPGTRAARSQLKIDWSKQPLGIEFDAEIARRLGVDAKTVTTARKRLGIPKCYINWDIQPLGEVTDRALAEVLGVDSSTVSHARRLRGIAAKKVRSEVDWAKEPLGQISDGDIARGLGMSQSQVTRMRNRLGVAPFQRGDDEDI